VGGSCNFDSKPDWKMATIGNAQADGYEAWKRDVNDYVEKKKNFQLQPEPYRKVTNEFVKRQEVEYNPIT